MTTLTIILAITVALGYFALAFVVLPRIELVGASPGFRRAFRIGGIAFFAGCGLTHTHIAVHAFESNDLVGVHEVIFHAFQAVGVWVFVYVALRMIDVRVERRLPKAEQLQEQVQALSRSNEDLEQFAHVVSHDLQGPLRTATGFVDLLERTAPVGVEGQRREYLEHLRASHRQMQEILDGVLRYSRAAGEGLERGEVDLGAEVREVLHALSAEIAETEATITTGPLPVIHGDRLQLRQILQNLIANALKFHGGRPPQIEIDAETLGDHVVLSVRDHGAGLEPGEVETIFEMFGRGRAAGDAPGSGIGLAISRKIALRHGGDLTAEPAPGRGAVFRLRLPAVAPAPAPSPATA